MCLNVDISIFSTFLNVWVKWDLSLTLVKNIKVLPVSSKLKVHCNTLCNVTNEKYLLVTPNIVWLSPDMIGGEFDIYSNVTWKIDIEPSEDDIDVVSVLSNNMMIENNTLFVNGDQPSQILEMLHNKEMITNETLLVDTSMIIIKEPKSNTRMFNKYYLKN